jgi:hypothetical protein
LPIGVASITPAEDPAQRVWYHPRMRIVLLAAVLLACGCPPKGGNFVQPRPGATAEDVIAKIEQQRAARTSFKSESVMDYRLGGKRLKGTVYVMGTVQRQVRFNAISPQQDVLADLACDGTNFSFVNMQQNCQLTGPCNKHAIATLLQAELEPEDVAHLALGTVPVPPQSKGTVTWDASKGQETVKLESPDGKQTIVIDARGGHYDIVKSELVGTDGKVTWSVENAGFQDIKDPAGATHRLPGKTSFKSPARGADLLVEWKEEERTVNETIAPAKFTVNIPPGLPRCQ